MGTLFQESDTSLPEGSSLWRSEEEVAGIQYHLAAAIAFSKGDGKRLEFQRDPRNAHDQNAIIILGIYEYGSRRVSVQIGFVSADLARLIATYEHGSQLSPRLRLIWRGDQNESYFLIKYDILLNAHSASNETHPGVPPTESFVRDNFRPVNYQEAFDWWQARKAGYEFPYVCPNCGTEIRLRKRVVTSRRRCPQCNENVSLANIDSQLDHMQPGRIKVQQGGCGCGIFCAIVLPCCAALAILYFNFWR